MMFISVKRQNINILVDVYVTFAMDATLTALHFQRDFF